MKNGPLTSRKMRDNKKFRPTSACADYAGWRGLILFANTLSPFFTVNSSIELSITKGGLTLSQTSPGFYVSAKLLENTVRKGEIARNKQFLLFPQCFLPFLKTFCHFHQIKDCHLEKLFHFGIAQNLLFGKGLKHHWSHHISLDHKINFF